jgi:HK97 family phage portal protein
MVGMTGINPGKALEFPALIASVRILSTVLSTVDLGVYRKIDGGFEPAPEHPVSRLIGLSPNEKMTSVEWRRDMITRMLIYGRSFDQILLNNKDEVIGLNPLHPRFVTVDDDGPERVFKVRDKNGSESTLKSREVLYIPYLIEGESLVEHATRSIGLGLSAEEFAQRFFRSGGMQQLKLSTEQQVGPDKKREIVESLHKSLLEGKTPFTDAGTKLEALQVKFEEVQLKETRIHQGRDVGKIIGVQPHLIGDLERSTNNNIEHQGKEHVTFTAKPLVKAIEQRLDMSLFGPREGLQFCARHDLSVLESADWESTCDGVSSMVSAGVMTPNEGRRRIGLNPHPDGGKLLIQGAMIPIAQVGQKQEASNAGEA